MPPEPRNPDRADRILDAAAALMLRLGYRKVTIEDVAKQAGIGKGTVYLHWRTKKELFYALLLRESIAMTEQLLAVIEDDPEEIRMHRFVRSAYLLTMRSPLLAALLLRDTEVLGELAEMERAEDLVLNDRIYQIYVERGLLNDIPDLQFALQATAIGFYLTDRFGHHEELDLETKADSLSRVVRRAFEPDTGPDPATIARTAAELGDILRDFTSRYRKRIYASDPTRGTR
ncbi:TetR/AcrR family transcriptional regulator [Saccharopolyspora taberi]|uniref:TetR/AcrR family transcriptional regulator n=1 Tax=Saccharopolyspora taberi TaxID=60895 RepID=A0ABN3VMF8_9PSEU